MLRNGAGAASQRCPHTHGTARPKGGIGTNHRNDTYFTRVCSNRTTRKYCTDATLPSSNHTQHATHRSNQSTNQPINQSVRTIKHSPKLQLQKANNNKHNNIIIQQQTSTTKPSNSNKHQLLNTEGRAGGVLKRLPITEVMKRELEVLRGRRVQGALEEALECATCHHKTRADSSSLRTP